jgi:hypothetical protein
MAMRLLTCPHCGAGFFTHDEVDAHGREAHRDVTPKEHDLEAGVYPADDFAQRAERDAQNDENLKKARKRIE